MSAAASRGTDVTKIISPALASTQIVHLVMARASSLAIARETIAYSAASKKTTQTLLLLISGKCTILQWFIIKAT
jgi:hypothetical protein